MTWLQYLLLFSTPVLGGLVAMVWKLKNQNQFKLILSFSGAFLFGIVLMHLLPMLFAAFPNAGVYLLAGFFIQVLLEQLTKGIEHGHFHVHHEHRFYILSVMIGLSLHSLLDGLPLADVVAVNQNHQALLYAICLHKIPEGFALASILIASGYKKTNAFIFILAFATIAPVGTLLSTEMAHMNNQMVNILLALAIGSFLHVSTTILFESETGHHHFGVKKFIAVLTGAALAFIS